VAAGFACAQLSAPNARGVSMGHVHFAVKDPAAFKQFWVKVLGAAPARHETLDGVRVAGMYVWIKQGEPTGGTDGSSIRDLGLRVRNLETVLTRAVAAGLHCRRSARASAQLTAPENVLLELTEDPQIATDVAADHIHLVVQDAMAARAWYAKQFGDPIPGIRLYFIQSDTPMAPTKGRALDHIGFEVENLAAFSRSLEAAGTPFEVPLKDAPDLKLKLAFLVDPWGTRIELTEGLERNPQ
jgi:catechol-2,3-dioxygenase